MSPIQLPTLTPLQMRRLVEITEAVRAVGYAGGFARNPKTGGFARDQAGRLVLDTPHAAAQAVVDSWDWTDASDPAETIRSQAAAAIGANDAFLALANPTAAQVRDHTRLLARQNTAVIRRLLQLAGL